MKKRNSSKVSYSFKEAKDKVITPINNIELPNAGVLFNKKELKRKVFCWHK